MTMMMMTTTTTMTSSYISSGNRLSAVDFIIFMHFKRRRP